MITVEALVEKPIAVVWESWTAPEHIMNWCFASDTWHAPAATNDIRTGGKFTTTMAAKDGSFSFDFGGEYTNVQLNETIEYTIGDGRTVSITFETVASGVKVVEKFEPEQMNPNDMQQAGWQSILDNFKKYTESL